MAFRRGRKAGCLSALLPGASSSPEPRGKPYGSAADVLADVCADMGVRFETTDPDEVRTRVCCGGVVCHTISSRF